MTRSPTDLRSLIILDEPADPTVASGIRAGPAAVLIAGASNETQARWRAAGYEVLAPADITSHVTVEEAKRATDTVMDAMWQVRTGGRSLAGQLVYRGIALTEIGHAHLALSLLEALIAVGALDDWLSRASIQQIWVPREHGQWGGAGTLVGRGKGVPVRRMRQVPQRVPLWPPTRRSLTQWLPNSARRWRERREAEVFSRRVGRQESQAPGHEAGARDVLGLVQQVSEARTFVPILRELAKRGLHSFVLVADQWTRGVEVLEREGLGYVPLQSLGPWKDALRRINRALPGLTRLWRELLRSPESERIRYRRVPVSRLLEESWRVFGDVSLRHDSIHRYLWWIECLEAALTLYTPRMVLVADESMPFGAIAVRIAERRGIPSLHITHGALPDHPKHRAATATKVAVGGDANRRFLLSRGTEERRIVVTGLPQFDPLADGDAFARVPVRRELGIPDGIPLAVYTMLSGVGVTPRDEVLSATREVLAAAEQLRGACSFVFKRHPGDRGDILSRMGVDLAAQGIVSTIRTPIHPLLWHSDVVITQMSTTGQEAIMLGKPLVVVNLSGKPDTIPYVEYGAALRVSEAGALAPAIRRALHDEGVRASLAAGRERFIADFAYRNDGKATERVLREIDRLMPGGG